MESLTTAFSIHCVLLRTSRPVSGQADECPSRGSTSPNRTSGPRCSLHSPGAVDYALPADQLDNRIFQSYSCRWHMSEECECARSSQTIRSPST